MAAPIEYIVTACTPERPPRLVTLPGNRYTFDKNEKVGNGQFGEVYQGRDRESGGRVAVKISERQGIHALANEYGIYKEMEEELGGKTFGLPWVRAFYISRMNLPLQK